MNKRIQKLIKKATTIRYSGPGEIEEFDKEKFAELLIRECCDVSDAYVRAGGNGAPASPTARSLIGIEIKKHFGVEE